MKNEFKKQIDRKKIFSYTFFCSAEVAQLVEQWIEDPRVTSSNLVLGMIKKEKKLL